MSKWYGAFYWAACFVATAKRHENDLDFYKRTYAREVNGHNGDEKLHGAYRKLWAIALKRVRAVWKQARKLKTSNDW